MVLNQDTAFKGEAEPHTNAFVEKLRGKVALSAATSQTLWHMHLTCRIFICQRKQDDGGTQHSSTVL